MRIAPRGASIKETPETTQPAFTLGLKRAPTYKENNQSFKDYFKSPAPDGPDFELKNASFEFERHNEDNNLSPPIGQEIWQ